jgi:hypothetical protein
MSSTNQTLEDKIEGKTQQPGYSELRTVRTVYNFSADGGAVGAIVPKNSAALPALAVIVGATVNSATAVTSAGAATVSIGTSAGSSATSILGATAKASFSTNALLNGIPVFATPIKLTTAGYVNFTVATAALTAGLIEVVVYYYTASA